MFFRMIFDNKLAQAAYLIGCQKTGEAIVIDPERDVDRYIAAAAAEKLRITAVAETHIHADYLSGVRQLAEQTGAIVYVSGEGGPDWSYEYLDGNGRSYPHRLLRDGDTFRVGMIELRAVHTPGHTPEHICLLVTDCGGGATEPMGIATGDFVFVGDLGRPDLLETAAGVTGSGASSAHTLFRSLHAFLELPDYLQVWPAHGAGSSCGKALGAVPQSTVGYERRFNPALKLSADEDGFVRSILADQPEPPLYFARMKRENKTGPKLLPALPAPTELGVDELLALNARDHAVLDTRPWPQFRTGHLPGALHVPLTNQFPSVAGSFVEADESIHLVCERLQVDEAVRCLVRIGLDNIASFATPATLEAATRRGLKLCATSEIDADDFRKACSSGGCVVLDVRRAAEFRAGHVPRATNIAHTRLRALLDRVPAGEPLFVHCQGGARSAYAASLLERHGFTATNVAGGFGAYEKAGGEVTREA